jgi:hypothetical protein
MYVVASHCVMVMEQIIAHIVYGCKIEAVFISFFIKISSYLRETVYVRVARFFSAILNKTGENIPTNQHIYQMAINYMKCL